MCILYNKLINLFIDTGNLPKDFEASYTVPISKCYGRVWALSVNDCRVISISPIISKLFELLSKINLLRFFKHHTNSLASKSISVVLVQYTVLEMSLKVLLQIIQQLMIVH